MDGTVELLEELSNADALPGFEGEVRAIFRRSWQGLGPLLHDRLGSVVVERPGPASSPRVGLFAHMDEVGLMVRVVTRQGLLRVVPLGGWWPQALPGQRVRALVPAGKVDGVVGATPPHLLGADSSKGVELKDLLVDVGAGSKEEVAGLGIRPGTPLAPATRFGRLAGSRVVGKAFDDRLGCALGIESVLALEGAPCTVVGVGCVQEEVGLRGVRTAARVARPDVAIVLEGSPADDVGGSSDEAQGRLGGGVQIRAFDPTMVAPAGLVELALEAAEAEGIPHQLAVRSTGGTDAGQLHLEGLGVPAIVLAAPVRYAHSHAGVLDLADLEATGRLARALVRRLDRLTVEERLLERGRA